MTKPVNFFPLFWIIQLLLIAKTSYASNDLHDYVFEIKCINKTDNSSHDDISIGMGFKLEGDSTITTAFHVVCCCDQIQVKSKKGKQAIYDFTVVAVDGAADAAKIYSPQFKEHYSSIEGILQIDDTYYKYLRNPEKQRQFKEGFMIGKAGRQPVRAIAEQTVNLKTNEILLSISDEGEKNSFDLNLRKALNNDLGFPSTETLVFRAEEGAKKGSSGAPLLFDVLWSKPVVAGILTSGGSDISTGVAYTYYVPLPEIIYHPAMSDTALEITETYCRIVKKEHEFLELLRKGMDKRPVGGLLAIETGLGNINPVYAFQDEQRAKACFEQLAASQLTKKNPSLGPMKSMVRALANKDFDKVDWYLNKWEEREGVYEPRLGYKRRNGPGFGKDFQPSEETIEKHPLAYYYSSLYVLLSRVENTFDLRRELDLTLVLTKLSLLTAKYEASETEDDRKFRMELHKLKLPEINDLINLAAVDSNWRLWIDSARVCINKEDFSGAIDAAKNAQIIYPCYHRNVEIAKRLQDSLEAELRNITPTNMVNELNSYEIIKQSLKVIIKETRNKIPLPVVNFEETREDSSGNIIIHSEFITVKPKGSDDIKNLMMKSAYPGLNIGSYVYAFSDDLAEVYASFLDTLMRRDPTLNGDSIYIIIKGTADGAPYRAPLKYHGEFGFLDLKDIYYDDNPVSCYHVESNIVDDFVSLRKLKRRCRRKLFGAMNTASQGNRKLAYLRGVQLQQSLLRTDLFMREDRGIPPENIEVVAVPFMERDAFCRRVEIYIVFKGADGLNVNQLRQETDVFN